MIIQVINKYLILSDNDITIPIRCGIDNDHPRLFANMDDDDNIYLYCMACEYKLIPGIELYERIVTTLQSLGYDIDHIS